MRRAPQWRTRCTSLFSRRCALLLEMLLLRVLGGVWLLLVPTAMLRLAVLPCTPMLPTNRRARLQPINCCLATLQDKGGSGPLSFLSNFLWSCIGITAGGHSQGCL